MSFSNINRKVINPGIVNQRLFKRQQNNVWNYVTDINKQLTHNKIMIDNTIVVSTSFVIDQTLIDQIIELYQEAGWVIDDVIIVEPVDNDPGSTSIIFNPPAA